MRSETEYAFLGVAHWCLHEYSSAFNHWRDGINAPYATGGICTQTPLLMLAGSILYPEHYGRAEVKKHCERNCLMLARGNALNTGLRALVSSF